MIGESSVRRAAAAVLSAALFVTIGAVAAPAQAAAVSGSTTSAPDVLYSGACHDHTITYAVAITPDVTHWNLDLSVLGPDGIEVGSDFLSSFFDPGSGTTSVQLCGFYLTGTYTVTGTGEFEGADDITQHWTLAPSTFTVREANSETTLTKRPLPHDRYRLTVRLRDERPAGYFPTDTGKAKLEKLDGGRWRPIPRTKISISGGTGSIVVSVASPTVKVRAVTANGSGYASSTSRPITLTRH